DGTAGLGINGAYDGVVSAQSWARIAVTVSDNGDGTSTLTKFIDGTEVGSQSVSTSRFAIYNDERGALLLADEGNETSPGYLGALGFAPGAASAADIAALGGVDAGGPFEAPSGDAAQFGFGPDGITIDKTFGSVGFEGLDTTAPAEIIAPIADMLVSLSDESRSFDLAEVFGPGASDFTVTGTNGEAVSAEISD
ncbi:MAG: hypothetical protein OIF48_18035, partial [Silicimonas sp.]|nr:hypothetical protein [Silicimonas sp.]